MMPCGYFLENVISHQLLLVKSDSTRQQNKAIITFMAMQYYFYGNAVLAPVSLADKEKTLKALAYYFWK